MMVLRLPDRLRWFWTKPVEIPPTSNVAAPINTSSMAQTKTGDLEVNGNLQVGGILSSLSGYGKKNQFF